MEIPPGQAGNVAQLSALRAFGTRSRLALEASGAILLAAVWIGLISGFLDVLILVVSKRFIELDFLRVGDHFAWLIPIGVTAIVLLPAMLLAFVALFGRRRVGLDIAVGVLSFVGILDFTVRLPIALWAALLLSGGLATQCARLVRRSIPAFFRLVRMTVPMLGAVLLVLLVGIQGGRAWSEHRALAQLPIPPPAARNVILIVWDTVRAENLSLHGYGRPTTPNLDRLAARGVRFDQAFSTSSWTLPSHASIFTGHWPHELGVDWTVPLGDNVPTLAEYLTANGYDTAGFVANFDYCSRETGLARGFAHYEDYPVNLFEAVTHEIGLGHALDLSDWAGALGGFLEKCTGRFCNVLPRANEHVKGATAINSAFLNWLKARRGRQHPFFAFLNFNDAHSPNEVPDLSIPAFGLRPANNWDLLTLRHWNALNKETLSRAHIRMISDIYDDCISYLDRHLGSLIAELQARGILDDTLLIITSDHGEHLGDHLLFFHGCSLYYQLVHVPLVIALPQAVPAHRVIAEPVSLRDLAATVVDLLGLKRKAYFPGQSLARCWNQPGQPVPTSSEPLLMETGKPLYLINGGREPAAKGPMKALVAGPLHYIQSGDGREELYDFEADRIERINLAGQPGAAVTLQRFRSTLSGMLNKRSKGDSRPTGPLAAGGP
jgi:arylsulfatase A-like enzyme